MNKKQIKILTENLEIELNLSPSSELRSVVRRYLTNVKKVLENNDDIPTCDSCIDKDKKIRELKTIISEGWKGKDELTFERDIDTGVWTVSEHRKNKKSGIVKPSHHEVFQEHIDYLWTIIKLETKCIGNKTKYRNLVPHIIKHYNLDINVEEFNGGVNRADVYFPLYYHPIKILEHLGNIEYGGRGTITRLK